MRCHFVRAFTLSLLLFAGISLLVSWVYAEGAPTIDGAIDDGEYDNGTDLGNGTVLLMWSFVDDQVYLAVQAETEGSIILSISPDQGLHDGDNLVMWATEDGLGEAWDCFCIDERDLPVRDLDRGGTEDLMEVDGSLFSGLTTVELRRPLVTEDPYDKPFPRGGSIYLTWMVMDSPGTSGGTTASGTEVLSLDGSPFPPPITPSQGVDGIVEEGEYANMASFGDGHYVLHWEVYGDDARFGIVADTDGWVALGIEPSRRMLEADMWFGWYASPTGAGALDAYSVGDFGPHPPDITLGGTSDILEYNVGEVSGKTTFEFVRRLETGDDRDNALPKEGAVTIVWATSISDVYSVKHDIKGTGSILMEGGAIPPPGDGEGIDGIVEDGEYDYDARFAGGEYRLHWKVLGEDLQLAIRARTEGWVSLGIDPEERMQGADMVLGWVEDGTPVVHDAYATGPTGPHPPDVGLGGTYDITIYNGTEADGWTTIELVRPLNTGDAYDKEIILNGKLTILWAIGDSDEFNDVHAERGGGSIEVRTGSSEETETTPVYTLHMVLIALGVGMAFSSYLPIRMKGRFPERRWFKLHIYLAPVAIGGVLLGVTAAYFMVAELSDGHLRAPHPYGGALALGVTLVVLTLGLAFLRSKELKGKVRRPHILAGYLALLLLVTAAVSGLLRLLELGWL
ncbi:MAG: hypothetical protein JSW25_05550 [Thermoplasmata archaeon]|nr:MAG: hypothetical protein JSW25_05550 [Thermoplasmata archaeon]